MAKTRKFIAYRSLERPYTRFSKYKKKCYVRAKPVNRIVRYDMGIDKEFDYTLNLCSKSGLQIRDIAIESARQVSNKFLEKKLGRTNYKLKLRIVPHHVLRENPLAAGAGADRMSTGMSHPFGKPIGIAAQIKKGQALMTLHVNSQHLDLGREAIIKAKHKFPCSCSLDVIRNR